MTRVLTRFALVFASFIAMATAAATAWAADPVFTGGDFAIKGYDPVAYFTDGKPVEGSDQYEFKWQGATWRFASADHLDKFKAMPEAYAPQYGGYCAYAVSQGYTAKIEPDAWKIVDGKLYLNYDKGIQAKWQAKQAEYIAAANKNWPGVLN